MFVLALRRKWVEADEGFVDESGMTHDEAVLRQLSEKLSHQHAEIGFLSKIISAGESWIESGDLGFAPIARHAGRLSRNVGGALPRAGRDVHGHRNARERAELAAHRCAAGTGHTDELQSGMAIRHQTLTAKD